MMKNLFCCSVLAISICLGHSAAFAASKSSTSKPTIILVHGAFADSTSWDAVTKQLVADGYSVNAVANPLRGLKSDAEYVAEIAKSVPGPVILVGHSYGGSVITDAAERSSNVKSLVFVAGLAPDTGESAAGLGKQFPTGTLGETLAPAVVLADGTHDLYIEQDKYPGQFAPDVPLPMAKLMAIDQRPITAEALNEASGAPGWKKLPSRFIYGTADKNIPSALHAFMAKRADAKEVVAVKGASHVVMISHPKLVTAMIERAATD
jgi:pimeloyl-ACP methyl ester carboxylesterase